MAVPPPLSPRVHALDRLEDDLVDDSGTMSSDILSGLFFFSQFHPQYSFSFTSLKTFSEFHELYLHDSCLSLAILEHCPDCYTGLLNKILISPLMYERIRLITSPVIILLAL